MCYFRHLVKHKSGFGVCWATPQHLLDAQSPFGSTGVQGAKLRHWPFALHHLSLHSGQHLGSGSPRLSSLGSQRLPPETLFNGRHWGLAWSWTPGPSASLIEGPCRGCDPHPWVGSCKSLS